MELSAEKSCEAWRQVAFLVPGYQLSQQPGRTQAPAAVLSAGRAPPTCLSVLRAGSGCAPGSQGHSRSESGRHLDRAHAREQPQSLSQQPVLPTARAPNKRARKANKDVLVSALLEAQEGGNQCLVNGKRENRSGKTVYFQVREGFVNSTGHCGGSTAGHKLWRGGGGMLPEPAQHQR